MNPAEALRSVLRRSRQSTAPSTASPPVLPLAAGSPAPRVEGVAPDGSAVAVDTQSGRMSLVFLTSECRECEGAWQQVVATPPGSVVVTPGPETESARRVASLSVAESSKPPGLTVVMSSDTWHSYGVSKAPWVVQVDSGVIVSSAPPAYD